MFVDFEQYLAYYPQVCIFFTRVDWSPVDPTTIVSSPVNMFWSCYYCNRDLDQSQCSLSLRNARFRMRITLEVVLIYSQVCAKCVPRSLRSGLVVALCYRFQKEPINSGESAESAGLRPFLFFGQLLCYSVFNFVRNLRYVVLLWSGSILVLCQVTPRMFLTILFIKGCSFVPVPESRYFVQWK